MPPNRKPRKKVHLLASSVENDHLGTAKDELNTALTQFLVDCANPTRPDRLTIRAVARLSEELEAVYPPRDDPPCRLYPLSVTAISEVLAGKRKGVQSFDWVASCVLSCQRYAVRCRPGRRDQGTTILPCWADIYAAHLADVAVDGADVGVAYRLPVHQQEFVLTHGPFGRTLLARAQLGHPHARYRVALLLACDPGRGEEAVGLLIDVATTGHPLSLDLLDESRGGSAGVGTGPVRSLVEVAARRAWGLAEAARACEADGQAYLFCRAAARGGVPEAVLELGQERLAEVDPEAAEWLGRLGTEEATGRHRVGKR